MLRGELRAKRSDVAIACDHLKRVQAAVDRRGAGDAPHEGAGRARRKARQVPLVACRALGPVARQRRRGTGACLNSSGASISPCCSTCCVRRAARADASTSSASSGPTARRARRATRSTKRCATCAARGGDLAVETVADQVRLGEQFTLDVDEFEAAVDGAGLGARGGLAAGEFAEGFAVTGATDFEDWLEAERRHWRARGVDVLAHRAEVLLAQGATAPAIVLAERALVARPAVGAGGARGDAEPDPLRRPARRARVRAAVHRAAQGGTRRGGVGRAAAPARRRRGRHVRRRGRDGSRRRRSGRRSSAARASSRQLLEVWRACRATRRCGARCRDRRCRGGHLPPARGSRDPGVARWRLGGGTACGRRRPE